MDRLRDKGPLTETDLDRLADFLIRAKGGQAMNLEEMDGFFAALIAGPEVVPPSEYLPEVLGGELADTCEFEGLDEANEILGLIMRHWNAITRPLNKGDVHLPLLFADGNGVCQASDWARGFVRGMDMCKAGWAALLNDEENAGALIPVLMLYHEHDEDPELRPGPITPEKREDIIVHMAAGMVSLVSYKKSPKQVWDSHTR